MSTCREQSISTCSPLDLKHITDMTKPRQRENRDKNKGKNRGRAFNTRHCYYTNTYTANSLEFSMINPWHTCAARVKVLGVCVCVSVLSVDNYSCATGYNAAYEHYQ